MAPRGDAAAQALLLQKWIAGLVFLASQLLIISMSSSARGAGAIMRGSKPITGLTTASTIALGSLWALIPSGLSAILYVVRTALEDRTLQEELDGYKDYVQLVRYRLLPGIW